MLGSPQKIRTGITHREDDSRAAIAEFIRTRGVTRCPTACLAPTQGLVNLSDRAALEAYATAQERLRQAQAAAEAGDQS
jgi:hypothetical protein